MGQLRVAQRVTMKNPMGIRSLADGWVISDHGVKSFNHIDPYWLSANVLPVSTCVSLHVGLFFQSRELPRFNIKAHTWPQFSYDELTVIYVILSFVYICIHIQLRNIIIFMNILFRYRIRIYYD